MPNTPTLDQSLPEISQSQAWLARAEGLIPCLTQTLAKGPGQHVRGVAPVYAQRGRGSRVWDVDGNEYIDYTMAVGPLVLGYCQPEVDEAIVRQLADGITFSLVHPLEVEVAELVRRIVPGAERVRFSKTGCDVTSAAVRLARAHTGRSTVLCCGYHGWHDWYIAVTDRNAGIPEAVRELTYTFNYNDIDSLRDAIDHDTAAIILEPTVFDAPLPGFLEAVRELCTEHGIVLIFDEMWTGFRLAAGGAQEYYGVQADLACFSKAIANGMPLSVLCGRADIMAHLERDVFFFTTFGGEALSLAAAKATMEYIVHHDVPAQLASTGRMLEEGIRSILFEFDMGYVGIKGYPARTMLTFDANTADPLLMKSYIQQELTKRGILWNGFHTISAAHSNDDIRYTIEAYREVLSLLRDAIDSGTLALRLLGTPMEPVFRKTSHFNMRPKHAATV
jgi:glutamate-1-semialdehyde aminotransferase